MDTISVGFVLKPVVMCLLPIKRNQEHTHTHPHFTLISQFHVLSLLTLFTLRGHGSWIFHWKYIYVLLSHIIAMYICIVDLYYLVCDILLGIFYIMQYIYSPLPYSSYVYICIDLYLFSLLHFTWHILYNEIYIYSHMS